MKAAVLSMACATLVFFLASGIRKFIFSPMGISGAGGFSLAMTALVLIIVLSITIGTWEDYINSLALGHTEYKYRSRKLMNKKRKKLSYKDLSLTPKQANPVELYLIRFMLGIFLVKSLVSIAVYSFVSTFLETDRKNKF
jgi:hypothetical protein